MNLSIFVRVIVVAGTVLLIGVIVDQVFTAAILAILGCLAMIALDLRGSTKFKSWISKPLALPSDDFGAYYQPAKKLHASLHANRNRTRNLINTAQKYKSISNSLPDALVILNDRMMIDSVNQSAVRLLGLTPADVGKPIATLIRHPDAQVLFKSTTDDEIWAEIPSPIESDTRIELRLFSVGNQETMLMARDVSESSRLVAMRQDFIANVSHELRTPLTVLIGYIESALNDELDRSTLLEIVQRLDTHAQRMKSLVDDLLTLTQLESSPDPELSALSEIDGKNLISAIIDEVQPLATPNHHITVEADSGVAVSGVLVELHSAFLNLVTNALRYSPDGGRIDIEWSQRNGSARFLVRDEGVGISPQHLPRITERFYRVDPVSSRVSGGTGLGLAIVKHVLKRHQSSLQVFSKLGQGSTFYCDLPLNRVTEVQTEHETL